MKKVLPFVKDSRQPVGDFLRINFPIWPLPDGQNGDVESKYFDTVYTELTKAKKERLNELFIMGSDDAYGYENATAVIKEELDRHTELIFSDLRLQQLVTKHTGAALHVTDELGKEFDDILKSISCGPEMVLFRTLGRDFEPKVSIGQEFETTDIWSASYDPISSLAFGLSNPETKKLYVLRIRLGENFQGGLFVENNILDTVKTQHEFTLASGLVLRVHDIKTLILKVPESGNTTTQMKAKVYYLQAV